MLNLEWSIKKLLAIIMMDLLPNIQSAELADQMKLHMPSYSYVKNEFVTGTNLLIDGGYTAQ